MKLPPPAGVIVMVPSFAPAQEVAVVAEVAVTVEPTTTVVLAEQDVPAGVTAVTVYVYEPGMVGAGIPVGFCCVDVQQFGPVQEYVAFVMVVAFRSKLPPGHTGPVLLAVTSQMIAHVVAPVPPVCWKVMVPGSPSKLVINIT